MAATRVPPCAEMGALRRRRSCAGADRDDRHAPEGPPELHSISEGRGSVDISTLPPSSGSRRATAPRWASGIIRRPAPRPGARPSWSTARPVRAEPAIHALSAAWRRAASKPGRSTSAATACRARAATSAISASSRTISPISSRWCARRPTVPLTLIGHSAGGGFALRVAASPIQNLFARTVLLAPYLGYNAPTNRPNSGGWASADIPRSSD